MSDDTDEDETENTPATPDADEGGPAAARDEEQVEDDEASGDDES